MEIDYQMALVLQHKLNQESTNKKSECEDYKLAQKLQESLNKDKQSGPDLDHKLAAELQEQFKVEESVANPGNNLVYKKSKLDTSRCLVDPSWEVIDPTPDIHNLFVVFNEKFFWGALVTVCVSWSKRMTTCAGICSYQGRGGMCSITLSEPLLKLRPRKDLVETLLHEMIHAYLFVTHNNKDRDGHGPEFHKHMYRINKQSGTNITVYHDFHDEVRLYKQHWWRCNGPCQHQKPYFGTVRRATNRAPGPNDRWFAEHSQKCGGTFIKVKEPEKPAGKGKENKPVSPKNDIRNYFVPNKIEQTNSNSYNVKTVNPNNKKPVNNSNSGNIKTVDPNNKKPVNNINSASGIAPVISNNIFGFTNLSQPGTSSGASKTGQSSGKNWGGVRTKSNSNSTITVTNKKPATAAKAVGEKKPAPKTTTATSTQTATPTLTRTGQEMDYSAVRNFWTNKYPETPKDDPKKRPNDAQNLTSASKVPKYSDQGPSNKLNCPVCNKLFSAKELSDHLDICLEQNENKDKSTCIICGKEVPTSDLERHVNLCVEEKFNDNGKVERKSCPICEKVLDANLYDAHAEKCLLKTFDDIEKKYNGDNGKVSCLSCGKEIVRSELNLHLEDCMNETIFDTQEIVDDDDNENDGHKQYNCPICCLLVNEGDMQVHLDSCLNIDCI